MGIFDFFSNAIKTKSLEKLRKDALALRQSHKVFTSAMEHLDAGKINPSDILPVSKDVCRKIIFVQNDILYGYHKLQGQFSGLMNAYHPYDFNDVMSKELRDFNLRMCDKLQEYAILSRDISKREHAKKRDTVHGFFGEKSEHYQEKSEKVESRDAVKQYRHLEEHIDNIIKIMKARISLIKKHGHINREELKAELDALKISFDIEMQETEDIFKQSVAWAFEVKEYLESVRDSTKLNLSDEVKTEVKDMIDALDAKEAREKRLSKKFLRQVA